MSLLDRINPKKTLQQLREASRSDEELDIEVEERRQEQEYSVYDRLQIDLAKLVAPDGASNHEDYFKVGDQFTRTLFIHKYPPQAHDNWLKGILRFHHAVDISIYVQPLDINKFLTAKRRQAAKDEAALEMQEQQGKIIDSRRKQRLLDTKQFIEAVETDISKPFQVGIFLTVRAKSQKELDQVTEDLERTLTSAKTRHARFRHKQGFATTLPLMRNELANMQSVRLMHTQGLMAMFPLSSAELSHESGVLIGSSMMTGSPIILNRFMQPQITSPNTCILGESGSGKSYLAKLEMLRWNYHGVPVIVLDPSGEYRNLAEGVGGMNVSISIDSSEVINPLDFSNAVRPGHNPLREKIGFLIELISVMLRSEDGGAMVDAVTKQLLDNALHETYRRYGYDVSDVSTQQGASSDHMPTMGEVYDMLARIGKADRNPMVQERIQPLLAGLAVYVHGGSLSPMFDQRTTVAMRSHFINFDYSGLPQQYHGIAMHMVLEFLRTSFFHTEAMNRGQKLLLYVDEAQILMEEVETAHFLQHISRTSRKYGVGLTVMTQNVGTFTLNDDGSDNKVGQGILANCAITVLLKQKESERKALLRAFAMTESELSRLLSGSAGEGLLYVGSESAWFTAQGMASAEEHEMITTTVSERAAITAQKQQQQMLAAGQHPSPAGPDPRQLSAGSQQPQEALPPPPVNPFA